MNCLVRIPIIFIILVGMLYFIMIAVNSFRTKGINHIVFYPKSDNETEYELRRLLLKYPNAIINTTQNPISYRLAQDNSRIIIHQEL